MCLFLQAPKIHIFMQIMMVLVLIVFDILNNGAFALT